MKILLINTPRSPYNSIRKYANAEERRFIHKRLIGPPLGLLILAAAVDDHEVVVWDTKGEYDLKQDAPPLAQMVLQLMNQYKPDIVGTTVITSEFYYGLEILQTAKKFDPTVLTVIGGVHATLCPEDFTDPAIDVLCKGQAAHIFKAIVEAMEKKLPMHLVPGAYLVTDSGPVKNKGKLPVWNPAAENYLRPDRSLLDRWRETYKVGEAPYPSTYMFSSLGCPYNCTFCSIWKEFNGVFMQREIESIIEELKETDYKIVRFSDANTIVNVEFIDQLFSRIEDEGIKKEYIMDIRSDTAVKYPDLIAKLARNGLKVVICGFESFREEELRKYNKSASAKLISQAIDLFHSNDIKLRGNYVVPNNYGEDDFKALADYANSHKVSYAGYTILTPMPGTVYYDEVKSEIIDHNLLKYNFFNCVLPTKLPLENFYENVAKLWMIKKGTDVI